MMEGDISAPLFSHMRKKISAFLPAWGLFSLLAFFLWIPLAIFCYGIMITILHSDVWFYEYVMRDMNLLVPVTRLVALFSSPRDMLVLWIDLLQLIGAGLVLLSIYSYLLPQGKKDSPYRKGLLLSGLVIIGAIVAALVQWIVGFAFPFRISLGSSTYLWQVSLIPFVTLVALLYYWWNMKKTKKQDRAPFIVLIVLALYTSLFAISIDHGCGNHSNNDDASPVGILMGAQGESYTMEVGTTVLSIPQYYVTGKIYSCRD